MVIVYTWISALKNHIKLRLHNTEQKYKVMKIMRLVGDSEDSNWLKLQKDKTIYMEDIQELRKRRG